jgi:F-type H+-transporting ATPase subunit delta
MKSTAAGRRYAKALFTLAQEESRVAEIREELFNLSEFVAQNPELSRVLLTPLHPVDERKNVLDALIRKAGLSTTVRHFMAFLVDQRRLVDFDGIREEYERLADEQAGLVTAEVVSARELDANDEERLRRALSAATGREVRLDIQLDPELIGGVIAKVGDLVFDGTLRAQLGQLRATMTKGS